MKTAKYIIIGAMMTVISVPTMAQDATSAIEQATKIIKSGAEDKDKQVNAVFKTVKKDANAIAGIGRAYLNAKEYDNADKYAAGGTVKMSCHDCGDGTYAIAVFNEGPAVAADDAEHIFEPFVRLYPEEHSLGIGLPLARRLAKLMGYEVTLDTSYTQGARFIVSGL